MAALTALPKAPTLSESERSNLVQDFERVGHALPADLPVLIRERYAIDLSARYGSVALTHPFGKGSGQLSLNLHQLREDAEAGLAFVVLKTVIAEDEHGAQTMGAWAIPESRMRVEPRMSSGGNRGWTVTWKGRGWDRSLAAYVELVRDATLLAQEHRMPVVASVKYHLPDVEESFRTAEYRHTTDLLARAWADGSPVLLEQDFSPTLAGDQLASERSRIRRWLRETPALIRSASPGAIHLAVKLMNAEFDDAFQLDMVRTAYDATDAADTLVLFNRLWDRERGVAYGGWDLSDRNLRVLDALVATDGAVPFCATGNIESGRTMIEYARRGATSGQLHTYFQLPKSEYAATHGTRTARSLHQLLLHPSEGLVAWLLHLGREGVIERDDGLLRFLNLAGR